MFYLLVTLYLPLSGTIVEYRFDDFRSKAPCILAKVKLMEHLADLEMAGKKSFITQIKCGEVEIGDNDFSTNKRTGANSYSDSRAAVDA